MPPIMECVVETGYPILEANSSHSAAASNELIMMSIKSFGSRLMASRSTMPERTVSVTSPPAMIAPLTSKTAAINSACLIVTSASTHRCSKRVGDIVATNVEGHEQTKDRGQEEDRDVGVRANVVSPHLANRKKDIAMRRPKAIFQPVFLPVASLKANDSAEFGFGARLSMPLQFRLKGRPDITSGLLGHENYGMTKTLVCCPLVICCSRNIRIYRAD